MEKKKQPPIKVVIFIAGGLVQATYCDIPLEITVLDLDEDSQDRWVRTESASSPTSEMPKELGEQFRKRR